MKHFLTYPLSFFLFLTLQIALAQNVTVSEEIYLKNDFAYDILGKLDGNIILFRDQGNNVMVQAFGENLTMKWEREIQFEKNRVDVIGVLPTDSVFNVFYGYRMKGDYIVKHKRYDGDINVVDTSTIVVYQNQYFNPRMLFSRSEDRSKVLLFRGDKDAEMDVFCYDLAQDTVIWDKQLIFRNTYLRRDFRRMVVSNAGDMFLVLENNRLLKKDYFEIHHINRASGMLYTKEIDLEENTPIDIFAEFDNLNSHLVIAGMYADRNLNRANGIYFARVNWTEKVQKMKYIPFSEELLEDVYGKRTSRNKGLTNFTIQNIVLRQDGGAIVIAEMNKEFSRAPNVPVRRDYMRSGWVDYYYEDLLVYSIHPDGEPHWNTVLKKRQYSQDDDAAYSSYFLFRTQYDLRLLFNDEIRQENTVSEYVLKGNGKSERNSVFSTDYQRLKLRFREGVQIAYDECIVPSERNNRLNLVRIRFN